MEASETSENSRAPEITQPKQKYMLGFTLDGEVLNKLQPDGTYAPEPLRTVPLAPDFDTDDPRLRQAMERFYGLLRLVKFEHPNRIVPVTRKELLANGIDKKAYRELLKKALLQERLIALTSTKSKNVNMGARACVYFTIQGRAFIQKYIDPSYAVTENV